MILQESYSFQQLSLIAWIYDAESGYACALFIPRISDSILDGPSIFASFVETLDSQRHLVRFGGAWFLRFIALVKLTRWIDHILELVLDLLREAESYTGHGC
ncbi:hypothetical protein S40293_11500 [Stachybotrys chartarum IBT 40293]|nr:hypothetical protein S40293_11500 [Stachybotrys chartarum IBT 40293]